MSLRRLEDSCPGAGEGDYIVWSEWRLSPTDALCVGSDCRWICRAKAPVALGVRIVASETASDLRSSSSCPTGSLGLYNGSYLGRI